MHILSLDDHDSVDPKPILAGPWRSIRLARLAPGEQEVLEAGAFEYAAFVVGGDGTATISDEDVALSRGVALTLVRGAGARLQAGGNGLAVFLVAVDA
jgi:hypothetical protein